MLIDNEPKVELIKKMGDTQANIGSYLFNLLLKGLSTSNNSIEDIDYINVVQPQNKICVVYKNGLYDFFSLDIVLQHIQPTNVVIPNSKKMIPDSYDREFD